MAGTPQVSAGEASPNLGKGLGLPACAIACPSQHPCPLFGEAWPTSGRGAGFALVPRLA